MDSRNERIRKAARTLESQHFVNELLAWLSEERGMLVKLVESETDTNNLLRLQGALKAITRLEQSIGKGLD